MISSLLKTGGALAGALLFCLSPVAAKDWDMDQGKYLSDLEIYLLKGPVQSVTTEFRKPDSEVYQLVRWDFDRAGNLLESRTIAFGSSCSKQVSTYDGYGNRLTFQSFSTQEQPLPLVGRDDCRFGPAAEFSTFAYEFDSRGHMTSRSKTYYGQSSPAVREEFRYDFSGNLVEHMWLTGPKKDRLYRNRYGYENSRGVRRIFRQANYDERDSAVDVRIVTTYDAKGKLLAFRKTPPDAAGFYNDYDSAYDGNGNLKSSGSEDSRTDYAGHDARGNWTRSTAYQGSAPSQTATRTIQYFK